MKYKRYGSTIAIRVDRGEEIVSSLKQVCEQEQVKCGSITGLGAVGHAVLGLYRVAEKKYFSNTFDGEMELTSLTGNVSEKDGEIYLHFHATVAKADGTVLGGHLSEAVVSGTGEIFLQVIDGRLGRRTDPETGLNLFDL
jgi:uncharacterized protein